MNARLVVSLCAALLCNACGVAPPAKPLAVEHAVSESRSLCLAPYSGGGKLETSLRSFQSGAGTAAAKPAAFVSVGREWVRVARTTGDPGFYLNVDACAGEALALEPEHVPALELRALRLMNDHRFEDARALAGHIVARDPESTIGYGTLSDALLELGRYDEAARAAQRQAEVRPGMASSARGSYLRWLRGDGRGAKLLIRDALIGRDPNDPEPASWVLAEAAALYWHEGDRDGADALYAEALKWLPTQNAALLGRARIALGRGDATSALGFLDAAERGRATVESSWLRGDALALRGDPAASERAYAEAVRIGRRGDRLNLALFLATRDRDPDEALASAEDEAKTRAGIYIDDVRAWALYRLGRIEEARAASEHALAMGTRDARLLYHAGAIRIAAGDAREGRALVAEALRLNPAFDLTGAREARALLAETPGRAVAAR